MLSFFQELTEIKCDDMLIPIYKFRDHGLINFTYNLGNFTPRGQGLKVRSKSVSVLSYGYCFVNSDYSHRVLACYRCKVNGCCTHYSVSSSVAANATALCEQAITGENVSKLAENSENNLKLLSSCLVMYYLK